MAIKRIRKYKIHREGVNIIIYSFILLLVINLLSHRFLPSGLFIGLGVVSLLFFLLIVNFFRSPRRHFNMEDTTGIVVAPADGKVVVIEEVMENEYFHDKRIQVSIFMSVVNVHANWYPVDGKVLYAKHYNGRFQAAWLPKSSTENERSTVVLETEDGVQILMRQVAGALARRIVTYAKPGDECSIEEHMGFIKFGSRVDVYLPLDTDIKVTMNQLVTGCHTVIAELKKKEN
ncbi:MAG: phosphatidylserine decarboxylase family protein [Candidatus Azobacteroides sp.]|nr:phosphatidylserine decarboxylase family protein [Candidatus Azobacteroides sp.]